MPEVKRVLLVGLNISLKGRTCNAETQEKLKLLLQLTFYLVDKLRRFKLSKEVCVFKGKDMLCQVVRRLRYIELRVRRAKIKRKRIDSK